MSNLRNWATNGLLAITNRNKLRLGAPACTWHCAGEVELLFALILSGPILPELVEGGNRQVLPVFWRFCPIAKTIGGRQRPSGQAMREQQRGWRKVRRMNDELKSPPGEMDSAGG